MSIGLRKGSPSEAEARACGFTEEAGTLGEVFDVIAESDFVILLISDGAQVRHARLAWFALRARALAVIQTARYESAALLQAKLYPRLLAAMKPGATLGLSHGFLLGVLQNDGVDFRKDINVVLNAPKVSSFPISVP